MDKKENKLLEITDKIEKLGSTLHFKRLSDEEWEALKKRIPNIEKNPAYQYGMLVKINDAIYGEDIDLVKIKNKRTSEEETLSTNIEWGYQGNSPALLAKLILKIILEDDSLVNQFYHDFMREIVAKTDRRIDNWDINELEIWDWILKKVKSWEKEKGYHYVILTLNRLDKVFYKKFGYHIKDIYGEYQTNLVKKVCNELGITQKELAEKLGVKPSAISNWASGDIPNVAKIALEQMLKINDLEKKVEKLKDFKKLLDSL